MPSNPEFTAPDYTSQTAAQYKANIDASIAANGADAINLGLVYSSSTLSVTDATGAALSSTNPGFVKFNDAGLIKYISVEDNQGFIDDTGSSEIIGNLFGFPTGVAVGTDVTFGIYAVANDDRDAVAIMASRNLYAKVSPAAANIGAPDDAVADAFGDFFSFDSLDETLYDGNPCTLIGLFRMQMSASDDWTVQTLDSEKDGIGMKPKCEEGGWELISTAEASSSANITFSLPKDYVKFKLYFYNVTPATNQTRLTAKFRSSGSDISDYGGAGFSSSNGGFNSRFDTYNGDMVFTEEVDNGRNGVTGIGYIHKEGSGTSNRGQLETNVWCSDGGYGYYSKIDMVWAGKAGAFYDEIKFYMYSGNIASGRIELYGTRRIV